MPSFSVQFVVHIVKAAPDFRLILHLYMFIHEGRCKKLAGNVSSCLLNAFYRTLHAIAEDNSTVGAGL